MCELSAARSVPHTESATSQVNITHNSSVIFYHQYQTAARIDKLILVCSCSFGYDDEVIDGMV